MKRDMTYSSYSWYPYTQNVCLNTKFVKMPDEILDLIKTHQAGIVDIKVINSNYFGTSVSDFFTFFYKIYLT